MAKAIHTLKSEFPFHIIDAIYDSIVLTCRIAEDDSYIHYHSEGFLYNDQGESPLPHYNDDGAYDGDGDLIPTFFEHHIHQSNLTFFDQEGIVVEFSDYASKLGLHLQYEDEKIKWRFTLYIPISSEKREECILLGEIVQFLKECLISSLSRSRTRSRREGDQNISWGTRGIWLGTLWERFQDGRKLTIIEASILEDEHDFSVEDDSCVCTSGRRMVGWDMCLVVRPANCEEEDEPA
ncbi:hypothetical protein EJ08DRAFT_699257 [Tothia fuscella]|uniref:Uncharacterized protein n=1 Tax=Tothia fuscella TaxID=1048955 RepID=A0A9P4NMC7_9PEZI|nr:hypothetical protein EJ08DRAFT_699257 [Tothia fuscella]